MAADQDASIRLTQYSKKGGCGAKLRQGKLSESLTGLTNRCDDPRILVGNELSDDAAVARLPAPSDALVMTTDVIGALVDDAQTFGAIAATNAISDVYAMGGRPLYALNLAFFPDDQLPIEVLHDIQLGAARACAAVDVSIVGGHTVCNEDLKYGLAVVGHVPEGRVLSNRGARAGQRLLLTKALGTGVVCAAIKQGQASEPVARSAIDSMCRMNQQALEVGLAHGATACTDVTGFGLFAHLRNILKGSGLAAAVELDALPVLPGAAELATQGYVPGGTRNNLELVAPYLKHERELEPSRQLRRLLGCDAQTSGGLLLCLAPEAADDACEELRASGHAAAVIGTLRAPEALAAGEIVLE
jgi:selenide,water dikinase